MEIYNKKIKEIAEIAGLTEPVSVSSRYNGKLIHSVMPLCETIASHTARRTFASLMTEDGMNTKLLQQLMGHSSITSTGKYNRLPSQVIISQMIEAWQKTTRLIRL